MSTDKCPQCGGEIKCLAGHSANPLNWYCADDGDYGCGWTAWQQPMEPNRPNRPLDFGRLRRQNNVRAQEWLKDAPKLMFTEQLLFHSNELGDEAGEVMGAIKKLCRSEWKIPGGIPYDEALQMVADELADVIISADLIGKHLGIDLSAAIIEKFNATSTKHGFITRL
jgi:NTP pyrophosphatase (non-canonical NTP hydrolase)